jgi:transcriptional regulator with XRE-family HTH domain
MLERQKYETFRVELKKARLEAEALQVDLAKNLRKPQSYISKVESGERNLDLIEFLAYCKALGLNPQAFIKKLLEKFS